MDDPIYHLLLDRFTQIALATGLIQPNDHPDDYYGSVDHQRDLFARLGLNLDDWDPTNKSLTRQWWQCFVDAQTRGTDIHGQALYEGDFALLGTLTGYTV